jgi:hypothetical protein
MPGHVLVVDEFHGSFELGDEPLTSGGDGDAFVAILDASGTPLGACGHGRSRTQRFTAIQPTSDGFVVAAPSRRPSISAAAADSPRPAERTSCSPSSGRYRRSTRGFATP